MRDCMPARAAEFPMMLDVLPVGRCALMCPGGRRELER
jgi:hypothetical protein